MNIYQISMSFPLLLYISILVFFANLWYLLIICIQFLVNVYQHQPKSRNFWEFIQEKTELKIDQPLSDVGTTSTDKIDRLWFSNKHDIMNWITTLVPSEFHDCLKIIQNSLSIIFGTFSSFRGINAGAFEILCKETYELY